MAPTSTSSTRAIWRERLTAQRLVGEPCAPEDIDGEPIGTWRRTPFAVDAPDLPVLRGAVRRYQAW